MSSAAGSAVPPLLREAVAKVALSEETDDGILAAARALAAAAGEHVVALVFFGSRRTGAARADSWSAYDVLAIVDAYRPFYRMLHAAGLSAKRPALLSSISRWLPPTQISIKLAEPQLHAKVSVLTEAAFRRETSSRRRDHFTIGRLFQPTRIVHARDPAAREATLDGLVLACAETWRWSRPWQPPVFDAHSYGRRALEISMAWEVRPEPPGRAAALWAAQAATQGPVFEALLRSLEAQGQLRRNTAAPQSWSPVSSPGRLETLRLRLYFSRSIARSTLRWLKHVLSFDGWLEYIARKATRHSGQDIVLSQREKRWPLVFLWGRVFRYLRDKRRAAPR